VWEKRRFLGPLAVSLALVILLSLSSAVSTSVRAGLADVFSPLQEALYPVFAAVGSVVTGIGRVVQAARRNTVLEGENEFLLQEVVRLREMEAENCRLRGLVDFQRLAPFKMVGARVIGREVRHWHQSVLVDKGSRDGVVPGAAVVAAAGAVGRVVEAGHNSARVLLLTDPNCRIGGLLQKSRTPGLVEGDGRGGCILQYLPPRTDVVEDEPVVTSGMGLAFPPGILVGLVRETRSEKLGLHQSAQVDPAVDFDRISMVMILIREEL